jgi:hypothetical protein
MSIFKAFDGFETVSAPLVAAFFYRTYKELACPIFWAVDADPLITSINEFYTK